MEHGTYRMHALWRVQFLAMFPLAAVICVVIVVVSATAGSGPPVWFGLLMLFVVAWNAYWWLFRLVYRLDLSESSLRWRTPLRSGTIALTDLVEMRPSHFGSNVEVLRVSDGSKILVWVRKGFADFMAEVHAVAPHVQARIGLSAKLGERLPGPRGFNRPK